MKQTLLSILFFLILSLSSNAQLAFRVQTSNPDSVVFYLDDDDYTGKVADIKIMNTSSDQIHLYWKAVKISTPSTWDNFICDWNTCYGPDTQECPSDAPNSINPGDSIGIQLHVTDGGEAGMGVYDMMLWTKENPANVDTVRVVFIAREPDASKLPDASLAMRLFPNPTQEYFYIQGGERHVHHIDVLSILGANIRSFDYNNDYPFFVGDLSNGMYMVYLYDARGKVLKIFRLRKK